MIQVKSVAKLYGKNCILKDINLEMPVGKMIAITGNNGSGKSTLLRIMAGVESPSQGTISYFGKDVTGNRKDIMKYVGYVPQGNPLMEELTVYDNLRLFYNGKKEIPENVLQMNGLTNILKKRVSTLSGGMQRRLTIACAMLHMPPIMLMDEPTTSLDRHYKELVWQWMDQYEKMGGTILIVSHDQEEIERCTYHYVVENGIISEK